MKFTKAIFVVLGALLCIGALSNPQYAKSLIVGGGYTDADGGGDWDDQGTLRTKALNVNGVVFTDKVTGPASATDNALVRFDLTTGKLVQNSTAILSDAGALSGITVNANVVTSGTVDPARLGSGSSISGKYLRGDSTWQTISGDVAGPSSATDNALARFDATTGKLLQNGQITENDSGDLLNPHSIVGETGVDFDIKSQNNIYLKPGITGAGTVYVRSGTADDANLDVDGWINMDTLRIAGTTVGTMVGDSGSGGTRGFAPAPGAGDAAGGKYLKADGTWAVPPGSSSGITALTGDVTASGSGSVAATIASGAVTEAKQTLADNTTHNVSTSAHGYAPKAPNDATKYLDGTGAWSVPANTDGTTGIFTELSINGGYGGPALGVTIGGTFGEVHAEGAIQSDVGLYAGKSGTSGSIAVYPSSSNSGFGVFTSSNHTGNYGVYTNIDAHTLSGNRQYHIVDVGADANYVMTEGTQTINGAKTFTNIALGTPASGVATNLTGTASGLTAGHVTTNANLTGDVTSVGNAATIPNDTVTYAKMQNVSATDKVLGRTTAGAGDVEEISTTGSGSVVRATSPTLVTPALGTPSSGTLTNCTIPNLSGDVSSSGNTTTIGASKVTSSMILDGTVALADMANIATAKVIGRTTAGTGVPEVLSTTGTGNVVMSASPTLTGSPATPTQTAGDNSTKMASTAYVRAAMPNPYVDIFNAGGSLTAAKVAGTYALTYGDPVAVGGTGTLAPIASLYLDPADYPSPDGMTVKLRIKGQLYTNDVAPTGNFTYGLYPITRPGTSGGAGLDTFTIGTVISGSNGATYTTPAADGLLAAWSSDFDCPTAGHYIIAVVTTGTIATSAHVHLHAQLQYHFV